MILITHDLGVVAQNVDNIGVMYGGMLMEESNKYSIYESPKHPYTEALLSSIPNTNLDDLRLSYIPGYPPNLLHPPKGCPFAPRCPKVKKICKEKLPPFVEVGDTRVRCWLYGGDINE
jgi:peptide/nickel transport system ATP-binding protein